MSYGIDFGAPAASIDWDQFVSPNPWFNTTAEIAQFCLAGLTRIGFPKPAHVWIQGQHGDGMAAVQGAKTMELGRALSEGLDPKKLVNVMVSWKEDTHSVAMIVKPLSGSVFFGGKTLFEALKPEYGWEGSFEQFVFAKNGNPLIKRLADLFTEAR